jgi:hypothetical protein
MGREEVPRFLIDQEGVLWYNGRLCVPRIEELKQFILKEAHDTPYSIHLEGTKMYQDLKERFWWHGMKREIASYIARCDVCQRIKAEHQRPAGLLQPLKVPLWKWEEVGMDFYYWATDIQLGTRLYMGHCGPPHQGRPLHPRQDH